MSDVTNDKTIKIDGKDYKLSDLSDDLRNTIVALQEILKSKVRHDIELEKIKVLTDYYNDKIKKEIEKIDGSES